MTLQNIFCHPMECLMNDGNKMKEKEMKIKGAIFDMDGTLVDSLMFWGDFWKKFGKRYMNDESFKVDEKIDKKVRTMIFGDALIYMRDELAPHVSDEEILEFGSSGIVDFYIETAKIKPGAYALIEHLKSRGIKICIATATDMKYVRVALDSCKLSEHFDIVMSCADIGVGKDKPDIYIKAMNTLGFKAEEICVFEDSFVALETAKKAGFKTVGLYDKYNFEQERLRAASDIYMEEGETLEKFIEEIN